MSVNVTGLRKAWMCLRANACRRYLDGFKRGSRVEEFFRTIRAVESRARCLFNPYLSYSKALDDGRSDDCSFIDRDSSARWVGRSKKFIGSLIATFSNNRRETCFDTRRNFNIDNRNAPNCDIFHAIGNKGCTRGRSRWNDHRQRRNDSSRTVRSGDLPAKFQRFIRDDFSLRVSQRSRDLFRILSVSRTSVENIAKRTNNNIVERSSNRRNSAMTSLEREFAF